MTGRRTSHGTAPGVGGVYQGVGTKLGSDNPLPTAGNGAHLATGNEPSVEPDAAPEAAAPVVDLMLGASFAELLPRATRLAYLLCGDEHTAQQIAQDTTIRCLQHRGRLRDPRRAGTYLDRAVTRAVLDHQRSAARRTGREARAQVGVPVQVAGIEDEASARVDIMAALSTLPRDQRAVVVLRFWADHSEHDIATLLRCRPGTVKSRLNRALTTLRRTLE